VLTRKASIVLNPTNQKHKENVPVIKSHLQENHKKLVVAINVLLIRTSSDIG
jgi:hypothetical protein